MKKADIDGVGFFLNNSQTKQSVILCGEMFTHKHILDSYIKNRLTNERTHISQSKRNI